MVLTALGNTLLPHYHLELILISILLILFLLINSYLNHDYIIFVI